MENGVVRAVAEHFDSCLACCSSGLCFYQKCRRAIFPIFWYFSSTMYHTEWVLIWFSFLKSPVIHMLDCLCHFAAFSWTLFSSFLFLKYSSFSHLFFWRHNLLCLFILGFLLVFISKIIFLFLIFPEFFHFIFELFSWWFRVKIPYFLHVF